MARVPGVSAIEVAVRAANDLGDRATGSVVAGRSRDPLSVQRFIALGARTDHAELATAPALLAAHPFKAAAVIHLAMLGFG